MSLLSLSKLGQSRKGEARGYAGKVANPQFEFRADIIIARRRASARAVTVMRRKTNGRLRSTQNNGHIIDFDWLLRKIADGGQAPALCIGLKARQVLFRALAFIARMYGR
jgi:hypothetical protein